jgi:hypothetical protein
MAARGHTRGNGMDGIHHPNYILSIEYSHHGDKGSHWFDVHIQRD